MKIEIDVTKQVKNAILDDYWHHNYSKNGICVLCGNSGEIDTTGVKTNADFEVGKVSFCICPNGRKIKEFSIPTGHGD